MLQSLHIENYALIARLSLEFGPGLNLLTGETGSGKSIVVDALGLLLGGKGSPDLIRGGADRALITGSFSLRRNRALTELAEEMGFELAGEETLVKRELQSSGKTRAFLNDSPVTVAALRGVLEDVRAEHRFVFVLVLRGACAVDDQHRHFARGQPVG